MNSLKPMLLTCLKSYDKSQFIKDVTAGIIVAIIALPLSIALALASGVGPEAGIFTAIVAGFVISALGGSCVQIAGPTAAFATIVAGIVARDGMDGLIIATVMAGVFLILMGLCHFGSLIKFIPYTITTGFTSGIAVTIVIGQLKDFFGVTYPDGVKPIETTEKMEAFVQNISSINTDALIVGVVSLAILIIAPYIFKKVPGSLIAVIVGILMVQFLPLKVSTIGNLYTISNSLPSFHMPALKFSTIGNSISNAFTIAVLAAIESLLSCVVAIEIGMVLACLLFIKRMSEETHVDSWVYNDDDTPDIDEHLRKLPLQIRVYEITGPLFFGAADAIEHIVVKDFTKCLILRMRSVPALDSTAMNALQNLVKICESKGITLVFSHVNEQPMRVMQKAGFVELVGEENFQASISDALKRAEEVI